MSTNSFNENRHKNKDHALGEHNLADTGALVHDVFLLFGDSITQIDGDPALGCSCYQALQHDTRLFG